MFCPSLNFCQLYGVFHRNCLLFPFFGFSRKFLGLNFSSFVPSSHVLFPALYCVKVTKVSRIKSDCTKFSRQENSPVRSSKLHSRDSPPFPFLISHPHPPDSVRTYGRTYVRSVSRVTTKQEKGLSKTWQRTKKQAKICGLKYL